ncbi:MAG: 4-alpha-glucanotransferase, partial [Pygmaiobacter sp.]
DNTTTKDWFASESKKTLTHAREYLCIHAEDDVVWAMVNAAEKSCANTCILPIGDLLSLGREGRINVPATLGSNWDWRLKPELLTGALLQKLYALTAQCGRI